MRMVPSEMDASTLLTLVSIALTALFAILGLLTDFRNKNKKITVAGKVSLVGVLLTSLLSGAITVVSSNEHKLEVATQLNPMDKNITAILEFTLREDKGELAKAVLDRPNSSRIEFYANGPGCSQLRDNHHPDLVFVEGQRQDHAAWFSDSTVDMLFHHAFATSLLNYSLESTSTQMTSVLQIPGSTVLISFDDFASDEMTLNRAVFYPAQGVSFEVPSRAFVQFGASQHPSYEPSPTQNVWTHEACFAFPKAMHP